MTSRRSGRFFTLKPSPTQPKKPRMSIQTSFQKDFAVRFGFLMSIPAVCGAVVFKLPDLLEGGLGGDMLLPCAVGFVTAAVCGWLAIFTVKLLVKNNTFQYFSIYCLAVGLLTIVLNLI